MDFSTIKKTPLYNAFSELGKRIYLPEGVFHWSTRAKKEAEIVGTIGAAYAYENNFISDGKKDWIPCYLKELNDYIKEDADINEIVPYPPIGGISDLRSIWKDWIVRKAPFLENEDSNEYKILKDYITTPLITSGVTNGIFLACALFLDRGDYVISPNKRWGNYDNIIKRFYDAEIKSFPFFKEGKLNLKGLERNIQEIAKIQNKLVLTLNFPNNPTGYVPTNEEAHEIVNFLRNEQIKQGKPFIVFVDDAYEPYVYSENHLNHSLFYELQQLKNDVIPIKLDGITKEFLIYGGRIGFLTIGLKEGWITTQEELLLLKDQINNKLEGLNRSVISNPNHFYQSITYNLFKKSGIESIIKSRDKVKELLKERFEIIISEINKIENKIISLDPNGGGFFVFLNLDPNVISATTFADHLLRKYKVGVIPVQNEEEQINGIRIAYCSIDSSQIPEVIKRINQALKDF
ncbi:MAG: aminotransferase class I/II-fold pyridoxal phosphate-dependent enzyme [Candidatus Lokiarchaeota archaeon]